MIGLVDYWTGLRLQDRVSFSIFYTIPVLLFSWHFGARQGIALSFLSAIVWHSADRGGGHDYVHAITPYWNATVRLGFFLMIAVMFSRVKQLYDDRGTLLQELGSASREIKTLRDHIPVCVWCNRIRGTSGQWKTQDLSAQDPDDTSFTHGICPSCYRKIKQEKEQQKGNSVQPN